MQKYCIILFLGNILNKKSQQWYIFIFLTLNLANVVVSRED